MRNVGFSGKQIIRLLSLFWLLIYFSGIVAFNTIHRAEHEHATVSHSQAQERDLCHRAIYHHETGHGCKHKAHFVPRTTCEFCDAFCSPVQENHAGETFSLADHSSNYSEHFQSSGFDHSIINLPARAPPVQG